MNPNARQLKSAANTTRSILKTADALSHKLSGRKGPSKAEIADSVASMKGAALSTARAIHRLNRARTAPSENAAADNKALIDALARKDHAAAIQLLQNFAASKRLDRIQFRVIEELSVSRNETLRGFAVTMLPRFGELGVARLGKLLLDRSNVVRVSAAKALLELDKETRFKAQSQILKALVVNAAAAESVEVLRRNKVYQVAVRTFGTNDVRDFLLYEKNRKHLQQPVFDALQASKDKQNAARKQKTDTATATAPDKSESEPAKSAAQEQTPPWLIALAWMALLKKNSEAAQPARQPSQPAKPEAPQPQAPEALSHTVSYSFPSPGEAYSKGQPANFTVVESKPDKSASLPTTAEGWNRYLTESGVAPDALRGRIAEFNVSPHNTALLAETAMHLCRTNDKEVQMLTLVAMERSAAPRQQVALELVTSSADSEVVDRAAALLRDVRLTPSEMHSLIKALNDRVRGGGAGTSADALADTVQAAAKQSHRDLLLARLVDPDYQAIRPVIARAFGKIAEAADSHGVQVLIDCLGDQNPGVSASARHTLQRMGADINQQLFSALGRSFTFDPALTFPTGPRAPQALPDTAKVAAAQLLNTSQFAPNSHEAGVLLGYLASTRNPDFARELGSILLRTEHVDRATAGRAAALLNGSDHEIAANLIRRANPLPFTELAAQIAGSGPGAERAAAILQSSPLTREDINRAADILMRSSSPQIWTALLPCIPQANLARLHTAVPRAVHLLAVPEVSNDFKEAHLVPLIESAPRIDARHTRALMRSLDGDFPETIVALMQRSGIRPIGALTDLAIGSSRGAAHALAMINADNFSAGREREALQYLGSHASPEALDILLPRILQNTSREVPQWINANLGAVLGSAHALEAGRLLQTNGVLPVDELIRFATGAPGTPETQNAQRVLAASNLSLEQEAQILRALHANTDHLRALLPALRNPANPQVSAWVESRLSDSASLYDRSAMLAALSEPENRLLAMRVAREVFAALGDKDIAVREAARDLTNSLIQEPGMAQPYLDYLNQPEWTQRVSIWRRAGEFSMRLIRKFRSTDDGHIESPAQRKLIFNRELAALRSTLQGMVATA